MAISSPLPSVAPRSTQRVILGLAEGLLTAAVGEGEGDGARDAEGDAVHSDDRLELDSDHGGLFADANEVLHQLSQRGVRAAAEQRL